MKAIEERSIKEFVQNNPATSTILFFMIVLHLLTYVIGNGPSDAETAKNFGALYSGNKDWSEFPYLLTSTYQHLGGMFHLLSNVFVILISAPFLEKIYGTFKFVLLFNLTGIFASLVTLIFQSNALSSGASGAAFGLLGIYIALIVKKHPEITKSITQTVISLVAINVIVTYVVPGISITGHLGGLLGGMLLGMVFLTGRSVKERTFTSIFKTIAITLGLFGLLFVPQYTLTNKSFTDVAEQVGLGDYVAGSSTLPFFSNNSIYNELNWLIDQYNNKLVPHYNHLVESYNNGISATDSSSHIQVINQMITELEKDMETVSSHKNMDETKELQQQLLIMYEHLVEAANLANNTLELKGVTMNEQFISQMNVVNSEYEKFNNLLEKYYNEYGK
ncbi:rhomboid family intramembrane serine protease [Lysinibacillus sp. BW-2-10]|uniref:rhomboid family intramembrane serine protease n=1 Tax=Lysinibacillus sp. BW-2-10 TaxID=2590030 RepID=UPI00117D6388|nr:rhomboid family intramembrane serine protease [Lysinibacillus sp. BW-2-10]TSI08699.1 rhomboid family intramembrane serine protease [Lysinibacillus sp. BW-2-10]